MTYHVMAALLLASLGMTITSFCTYLRQIVDIKDRTKYQTMRLRTMTYTDWPMGKILISELLYNVGFYYKNGTILPLLAILYIVNANVVAVDIVYNCENV